MIRCEEMGSEALVFSLSRWNRVFARQGTVLAIGAWPFGYAWIMWRVIYSTPYFELWPSYVIGFGALFLVMFVFLAVYFIRDLKNLDATITVTKETVTRALPGEEPQSFRWAGLRKVRFNSYGAELFRDEGKPLRLSFHHQRGLSRRAFRRITEWAELDLDGVQVQGFLGWRPWRGR